jgi:hypothetical protein
VPQAAGTVWPAELGLVVPEYAVATGDLPRICVVTGVPTENMVRMRWLWAPSWTFFLGLLIRYLIADKAAGYLPIHPSVRRKRRQLELSAVLAFVAGLVVMVAGAAGNQPVIALLGAAVVLAGLWTLSVAARPTAPVRRAGPGYLALPKASPAFAAAFRAGRPAGQQPYRQEPLTYKTRKAFVVPAVILALLLVPLGIYGAVQAHSCSAGTVHPNAGVVDADFAYSRGIVAGINAQTGGQGLTPAGAQQLVAEHSRLLAQLQSVHLSRADRAAVDAYSQTMTSYDNALTAAEQRQDDVADQALRDANLQLTNGGQTLSAALHSVSADCARS